MTQPDYRQKIETQFEGMKFDLSKVDAKNGKILELFDHLVARGLSPKEAGECIGNVYHGQTSP